MYRDVSPPGEAVILSGNFVWSHYGNAKASIQITIGIGQIYQRQSDKMSINIDLWVVIFPSLLFDT